MQLSIILYMEYHLELWQLLKLCTYHSFASMLKPRFYLQIVLQLSFLEVNCHNLSASLRSALSKAELLWHSSNGFLTIIRDHAGRLLTGNRKNKRICQISGLESGRDRQEQFKKWSLAIRLLKQYLTEKQSGYSSSKWSLTGGARLREVVAMRELYPKI